MAERIGVPLPALATSGLSGARFAKEYTDLNGHLEKRLKVFNALRIGQMFEEAGLSGLLSLADTPAYGRADPAQRQQMIQNYLGILAGGEYTPPAPAAQAVSEPAPTPEQPAQPEPAPPAEAQQPVVTKSSQDMSITKTEQAPEVKPRLPGGMGKMIDSR